MRIPSSMCVSQMNQYFLNALGELVDYIVISALILQNVFSSIMALVKVCFHAMILFLCAFFVG